MTIDSAQTQIYRLQNEIEELRVEIMGCDRVINALTEDISLLEDLKGKVNTIITFANNITTSSINGEGAFINGAYYVGQHEGNSKSFKDITEKNNETLTKLNEILHILENKKAEANVNISITNNSKNNHQDRINYCNSQIDYLRQWIENEIRRQEEEARRQIEEQNTQNNYNYW